MGECLSICNNEKKDFEDTKNVDNAEEGDENDDINISLPENLGRTEKNKTRIPKNVIVDDDEEILPTIKVDEHKESNDFDDNKNDEDIEKIKKARHNWEYLIDKLIKQKIEILREIVKK